MRAVEDGDQMLVDDLLRRFADPNSRERTIHPRSLDMQSRCALHYAAELNRIDILRTLLRSKAE